jgi:hypothetical protein
MLSFVENFATVALVEKAMVAYKVAHPGLAATKAGKVVGAGGMLVAQCVAKVVAADAIRYAETGQHVTQSEVRGLVWEGVIDTIGTLIAEAISHKFLPHLHGGGPEVKKKIARIDANDAKLAPLANKLKEKGATGQQAENVLRQHGENLDEKKQVIDELDAAVSDPESARAKGYSDADVAIIRHAKGLQEEAAAHGKLMKSMVGLRSLGGNTFVAEGKGRFEWVLEQHPGKLSTDPHTGQRTLEFKGEDGRTIRVVEDLSEGGVAAVGPDMPPIVGGQAAAAAARDKLRAERREFARQFYQYVEFKGNIESHLDGIDFDQPLDVVELPIGKIVEQLQFGDERGNYYTEAGRAQSVNLGVLPVRDDPKTADRQARSPALYVVVGKPVKVLRSRAGSVEVTWQEPKGKAAGGSLQYFGLDRTNLVPYEGEVP